MSIPDLPLDVWTAIIEHLSLDQLVAVYNAFVSTDTVALCITNRMALKKISTLLVTGTPKLDPCFAQNGPCYRFQLRNPRAGPYRHQQDHGEIGPCSKQYSPGFSLYPTLKYAKSYSPKVGEDIVSEMTILANNGQPFDRRCARKMRPDWNNTGPTELIEISVQFSPESTPAEGMSLVFDTSSKKLGGTFSDLSRSCLYMTRTVSHILPLVGAFWVYADGSVLKLPLEWFEFLRGGIWTSSAFSKEQANSPGAVEEWQWKMLSFESKWNLPLPLSSNLLESQISDSEVQT